VSLAARLLGPDLGVRLRADQPDTNERRTLVAFSLMMGPLFLGCGAVATASLVASVGFADPLPGYRSGVMAVTSIAALGAGAMLVRSVVWPRPWLVHLVLAMGAMAITFAMYCSGPVMAPYSSACYVLVAIGLATFLDRRAALVHLVFLALCAAVGLAALSPIRTPGGQWIILVGFSVVGAFAVDLLVSRLAETLATAQEAQRTAGVALRDAEQANAALAQASQHKSDFLAGMSHELRTPLNAVIGFAEVLAGQHFGPLNERQSEYVDDIQGAGQHLLTLINDILDLSKVEAGLMEISPEWFSLTDAVESAVRLVRPRADAGALALGIELADDAGEAYGDQRRVRQVLVNLLANAVKFTRPGGSVTVAAHATDTDIVVTVRDTGIGIAPDDLARVFDVFRQVGSPERAQEGTGLGLSLSRRFLDLHGGEIWATSEPGVGSAFTFRLPLPVRSVATTR
jgi:signal transduction histidine kinase